MDQAVLRTMAERVGKGDWLHVFPEGKVSKTPQELGRLKWGLGKMLCDVHANGGAPPVVLPFWHSGMEKVKRYGLWGFFPFNRVHVTVGEPVEFADLTARAGAILVGLDALPPARRLRPLLAWICSLHNVFASTCIACGEVFPPHATAAHQLLPPTARSEQLEPFHPCCFLERFGRSAEEMYVEAVVCRPCAAGSATQ